MIVVFHMLYYVANIIWNKVKPKLLSLEEDKTKKIPGESKNTLYALEKSEGDLDNSEEFDNYDPKKDVCVYDQLSGKLTFVPPLYIQRYKAVVNVLTQEEHAGKIHTIVEYGCAEFSMLKYYKNVPGVSEVLFVDIDEELLVTKSDRVVPLSYDYLMPRDNVLSVKLYCGDVSVPDERMQEADVVVAIELIEHLYPPTLEAVPHNLFGFIQPPLVIITTPNGEFNHLFDDYVEGTFRHDDHKFEWTRKQFQSWAENIVTRYPTYSLQISGIGPPPQGKSQEQYGHCSQIAVFTRIGPKIAQHASQLDAAVATPYKLIKEVVYPEKPPDTRSPEAILFDEMTYLLFSWKQDLVPLSKLYDHLHPWCSSVEHLRETLERNCRRVIFNKEEQEWYLMDDSRTDPLQLSDSEEKEQEALVSYPEEEVNTGVSHAVDNSWETWDEPASSTGILEAVEAETEHSGTVAGDNVESAEEALVPEKTVDREETTEIIKTVYVVEKTKSPREEKVSAIEETVVKKKKVNFLVETDKNSLNSTKERADVQLSFKSAISEDTRKGLPKNLQTNQETSLLSNSNSSMFSQDKTPPNNSNEKDSTNSEVRELLNYLLTSKLSKMKTEEIKTVSTLGTPISCKTNLTADSETTQLNKDVERTETGSGQPVSIVFRNESTPTPTDKITDQTNLLDRSPQTMLSSSTNNNWNTVDKNQEDRGKIRSSNLEQYIRDNLQSGLDKYRKESVIYGTAKNTGVNETINADTSYDVTNGANSSNFEVSNNSFIDDTINDAITDAGLKRYDVTNDADSNRYDVTNDADVDTSDDEEQSARDEKVRHLSREMSKVEAEIEKLKRDEAHPVLSTSRDKDIAKDLTDDKVKDLSERKLVKEGILELKSAPEDSFVVDSQNSAVLNSNSDCYNLLSDLSHSNFPAHSSILKTTSSSEFDSSLNLSSILVDTTRSNSGTDLVVSYNLKDHVTEYDSSVDDSENQFGNLSDVYEKSKIVKETSMKEASHVLNQNDVMGINNQREVLKNQKDNISINKLEVVSGGSTKYSSVTFHDIPDVLGSALASTNVQISSHKTDKLKDITNENSQNISLKSQKVTGTNDVLARKIEQHLESKPSQDRVQNKDKASELNSSQASGVTEATSGAQTNLNREINHLQTKLENLTLYSPEKAGRISEWVNQVSHSSGQETTKRQRRSLKLDSVENEAHQRMADDVPLQDEVPIISFQKASGQSYMGSKVPDLLKMDKSVLEENSKAENENTPKYTFDIIVQDNHHVKNGNENVDGPLFMDELDVDKLEMRKHKDKIDVTKQNLQNPDIASGTGNGDQNNENLSDDEESDMEDYMSCAETTTGSFHTVMSDARSNGSDTLSMYSCGDAQFESASEYQSSYYSMSSDSDSDETLVESDHDETFQFPNSVIHNDDD